MLFAELGPQYYGEKHKDILSRMESAYAESITINQTYWQEADTDLRFYNGDQTLINQWYGNLPANYRKQFNFNRIRPIVNMISGHQRRNRMSTIITPIENGDAETADQLTKVMIWCNNQESILETISEAFEGALITGMNLLQVWVDYRSDPISGNIKVDNCPYNSYLIDPYMRKHDLSDCNFIWKRTFLTKREAISLLPEHTDEIMGLIANSSGMGRDGKFQFMPESYNYGMKNLMTYDEYYYRDYRPQKLLMDTQTGETQEWRSDDNERLREFLRIYSQITVTEQHIPTVRLAIVLEGKVMYDGPNPIGIDKYPFAPVFSYYHPESPYWPYRVQGVVRNLRDAQYLYNRRKVIELDILESQVNSGWIYKENALVNPKDIFLSGQGRGIALKDEAQMTDVQQIQSPQVPPTTIQLSEILGKEIQAISGVNEELLGSAFDDKAGVLAMLRQGAGLTTLQGLFDQLDKSQKLLGSLMLEIIQQNFTPGKVKKILEGQEPTAQFYNKSFGRYNVVVEEGLNTATQRQMQFAQLLQLRETGVPVPDDQLLEASTLQNKKKLVESITRKNEQMQQAQQMQTQVTMDELQARAELARARASADEGLGLERMSRVKENEALAVERIAQAEKDKEIGLLNFVKALKEIDTIDLEHISKLIQLNNIMKAKEVSDTAQVESQVNQQLG